MITPQQALAALGAAAFAAALGAGGGWFARGVAEERADLQQQLDHQRGARVLEAADRRAAREASAGFQADANQIRAVMAQLRSEANHALSTRVSCPPGESSIELGDVPVPASAVDRLRRAAGDVVAPDRAASG
nr:hypothetical protein [uncultured Roseateles sp.]